MHYTSLAIPTADGLVYGKAPKPVTTRSGMVIGGGTIYPELNFTLPPMLVTAETWPKVRTHYQQIVHGALERAAELGAPGVQLEYETVPPMTENPQWGIEITKILADGIAEAKAKHGLKAALRTTPNDNREMIRPPPMRSGHQWEAMLTSFAGCCRAGADMISIESVGGKEIHDGALTMCDIRQVIFALCVMGVRDMRFLWEHIVRICNAEKAIPAGDSACGFANTAMVLAEQKLIPRAFAAIVRPISAVRSLVAYECGAVGPGKDCAYENPYVKAITGFPMAMEGKSATCAHLSPLGNIAAATADLWSNESVQNIKLLGGMAPTCSMESLIYDCRLMNRASADGPREALRLRDWLVDSDAALDPQAYVLTPANVIDLSRTIVGAKDHYRAGKAVALRAVELLKAGHAAKKVAIADNEVAYLDMIGDIVAAMPDDEATFVTQMMAEVDTSAFVAKDYGLA